MPRVIPENLRPYIFHGIDLQWKPGDTHAKSECPFCAKERKFNVCLETGQWNCWVCDESGNAVVFLRKLWKASDLATVDYTELSEDRKLLYPETLMHWGVARSILTRNWMVPGYNAKRLLCQLYQYIKTSEGTRLLPTPTLPHQLHGANLYSKKKDETYLCEGPWDGMILWETLGHCKWTDNDKLVTTANPNASLLANASVLAVPGCMVFRKVWCPLFAGKIVNLMYDSDHPRKHPKTGKMVQPAGYAGAKRVARILSTAKKPPAEINYLKWEELGAKA